MEWLNYHHLLYFWTVAKQGSIVGASKELKLAHPTISGQIHRLEEVLGAKLFQRKGRGLALTDEGRLAFRYAEQIFGLGSEFLDTIKGRTSERRVTLVVGVSNSLAKSIVYRMLKPAFAIETSLRVLCRSAPTGESFLSDLAEREIDVVLADAPAGPGTAVRTFSHPLGECGTVFVAEPRLARSLRGSFPKSLDGTRFILPSRAATFRRALDQWFDAHSIRPEVVAELDDSALSQDLAQAGLGVLAVPDVIESETRRRYKLHVVGRAEDVRQRFYAISLDRKLRHPGVLAICEIARKHIFA